MSEVSCEFGHLGKSRFRCGLPPPGTTETPGDGYGPAASPVDAAYVKWGKARCNALTNSRIDFNSRLRYHFG